MHRLCIQVKGKGKRFAWQVGGPEFDFQNPHLKKKLAVVVPAYSSSTGEVETGGARGWPAKLSLTA